MPPTRRLVLVLLAAMLLPTARGAVAQAPLPPLLDPATVEALADEISGSAAKHTIQELTLQHRTRASRGFRAAADAVARRAASYGLDVEVWELPADGERFYGTQRSRPAWDVEHAELWEVGADGARLRRLADWTTRPVSVAQDSASGRVEGAAMVDVGAGTAAEDYAAKDVAGKLVLTSSQPDRVERLAVDVHGAAGIVSYAQNQRTAWWGEDESLVRWGHLLTFPPPKTFAFMISPGEAATLRARLAAREAPRFDAEVRTTRGAGVYAVVTATIPGADPAVAGEEIVFSCHLDHQRPGANDNASGCAAILEVARTLKTLIDQGRIPPPRRTLRWVWPPEIEGTIALLNAKPELAQRARAAIHLDMVGGDRAVTKAILRVTRGPRSLPTAVSDLAESFGEWLNGRTLVYADSGDPAAARLAVVDPEGTKDALQAELVPFTSGSDHQVWAEGSFRVPAIYLNDWPDRYIHTHQDRVDNIDPTKLGRAAFLAAASGYALASADSSDASAWLEIVRRRAVRRAAETLRRASRLRADGLAAEAANVLSFDLAWERAAALSIDTFAPLSNAQRADLEHFLTDLGRLTGAADAPASPEPTGEVAVVFHRSPEPKGPMGGFGYDYFDDHVARLRAAGEEIATPRLLTWPARWDAEPHGAAWRDEALNLVDGKRGVGEIRDALAAIHGPVPVEVVMEYLEVLERIGVVGR